MIQKRILYFNILYLKNIKIIKNRKEPPHCGCYLGVARSLSPRTIHLLWQDAMGWSVSLSKWVHHKV